MTLKAPSHNPPRALTVREAREASRAVLDVRDEDAFVASHRPSTGNIPLAALEERRHELPPPDQPILVVADDPNRAADAARWLAAGYADVAWLDAPWSALGPEHISGPPARLWLPAPFLESVLPGIPRGRAIDVACGSGRNAVFLAMSGFDVEAFDHDADALGALEQLAWRHRVRVVSRLVDLESDDPGLLPHEAYSLVACFRFLHRPLLPKLADAVAPGGYIVYETYRVGQERFGRPRRLQFLLEPGELRAAFSAFEIQQDEELSPPGGPITSRLLARKPSSRSRSAP